MIPLTASKVALAYACPGAWVSGLDWYDPRSADAERGQRLHKAAERAYVDLEVGDDPEAAHVSSQVLALRERDEREGFVHCASEAAMAIDVRTGEARSLGWHRAYGSATDDEVCGTADLILTSDDGRVLVRDYKTGRASFGDPAQSAQMRVLAAIVSRLYRVDSVAVELVLIGGEEELPPTRRATLDAFELDAEIERLRETVESLRRGDGELRPGRHCYAQHCPVVASCPAIGASLERYVGSDRRLPLVPQIHSEEHAARVRHGIKAAEAALDAIRSALEAYVDEHGPVRLGDGLLYGPVEHEGRESIDLSVPGALDVLLSSLGEHAAAAVESRTSKAAIARAAKAAAPRGKASAKQEQILARLRELGAIREGRPFVKYEEHKE